MQRLVVAMLILAVLAGGLTLVVASMRSALRLGAEAEAHGPVGGGMMQKLSYVALLLLILGVATGWLGGL